LEVRRCGDGHPPVTKREREIRLNGIGGVIFRNPDRNFGPGFLFAAHSIIDFWRSVKLVLSAHDHPKRNEGSQLHHDYAR